MQQEVLASVLFSLFFLHCRCCRHHCESIIMWQNELDRNGFELNIYKCRVCVCVCMMNAMIRTISMWAFDENSNAIDFMITKIQIRKAYVYGITKGMRTMQMVFDSEWCWEKFESQKKSWKNSSLKSESVLFFPLEKEKTLGFSMWTRMQSLNTNIQCIKWRETLHKSYKTEFIFFFRHFFRIFRVEILRFCSNFKICLCQAYI